MFQAMALGHTCLSTVHGNSAKGVIERLMGPPYNVPRAMMLSLDLVVVVRRYRLGDRVVRRCAGIWGVGEGKGGEGVEVYPVFEWDGERDIHRAKELERILYTLSARTGKSVRELRKELERRANLIREMVEEGLNYRMFLRRVHGRIEWEIAGEGEGGLNLQQILVEDEGVSVEELDETGEPELETEEKEETEETEESDETEEIEGTDGKDEEGGAEEIEGLKEDEVEGWEEDEVEGWGA